MADTATLMGLDKASQGAIAPFSPPATLDLTPYIDPTISLFQTIVSNASFVPRNLVSVAQAVFNVGAFPRLRSFPAGGGARPAWLNDASNYDAWQQIIQQYLPIENAFMANNASLLAQEGAQLQSNTDFWNTIAKYSGTDAVEGIWTDFWNAVDTLKTNRAGMKASLDAINSIRGQYGAQIPSSYIQQADAAAAQFNDLTSKAVSALSPIPGGAQYAGLGVAPLIIAGIAAAVVLSVTGAVWLYARQFADAQVKTAQLANDLIKWRDQQDEADLNSGKINEQQFEQRRAVSNQLQTNVNKANGSLLTTVIESAGALAVVGLIGWLAYRYVKRRKSA